MKKFTASKVWIVFYNPTEKQGHVARLSGCFSTGVETGCKAIGLVDANDSAELVTFQQAISNIIVDFRKDPANEANLSYFDETDCLID